MKMNFFADNPESSETTLETQSGDTRSAPVAPVEQLSSSALSDEQSAAPLLAPAQPAPAPRDPVWGALDLVLLVVIGFLALLVGVMATFVAAKFGFYRQLSLNELVRMPLIAIVGQAVGYLIVLVYMYLLVTRHYHRPDFLAAIHWNRPASVSSCLWGGLLLSVALQGLAHLLPMPKHLPIDALFRTPAEAWTLAIFSITLAPLMEELFFRGFLYPVLARGLGVGAGVVITGAAFALLHGSQLKFAWGPVLVIFMVGLALTYVRAKKNSVAASLLIHVAYNGTIAVLMFVTTGGFRHLEKLSE